MIIILKRISCSCFSTLHALYCCFSNIATEQYKNAISIKLDFYWISFASRNFSSPSEAPFCTTPTTSSSTAGSVPTTSRSRRFWSEVRTKKTKNMTKKLKQKVFGKWGSRSSSFVNFKFKIKFSVDLQYPFHLHNTSEDQPLPRASHSLTLTGSSPCVECRTHFVEVYLFNGEHLDPTWFSQPINVLFLLCLPVVLLSQPRRTRPSRSSWRRGTPPSSTRPHWSPT